MASDRLILVVVRTMFTLERKCCLEKRRESVWAALVGLSNEFVWANIALVVIKYNKKKKVVVVIFYY